VGNEIGMPVKKVPLRHYL